jgi:Flp pilus assembly protein protease CpaA
MIEESVLLRTRSFGKWLLICVVICTYERGLYSQIYNKVLIPLVFVLDPPSLIAFFAAVGMLAIAGLFDWRDRCVPNRVMLGLGTSGVIIGLVTWHLVDQWIVHVSALVNITLPLVLYRIKALGGADVKAFILVAIISPGLEFATWENLFFEAFFIVSLQGLVMIVLGLIWSKMKKEDTRTAPLISFLLIGYVLVQSLAFL